MERFIYEHGWPDNTPQEEAIANSVQACADHCTEMGWTVLPEPPAKITVVQTPDHEAAGEYIVSLIVNRERIT